MQMVVQGASTRQVKKITTELCGREFSRSTVSRLTGDLDEQVGAWAKRPLDEHAYPFSVLDATAVLALPEKYRRRLRTTNMLERFIEEIRRRVKVIRIFPDPASEERLIGALCAETHEEWSTGRRYLIMDAFAEWKRAHSPEPTSPEPTSPEPSESASKPTTESPAAVTA